MKILLTGFEPFGGESINPALQATQLLHGCTITAKNQEGEEVTAEVVSIEVPVSWERALPVVVEAIEEHQPVAVLSVGQAGGRAKMAPEYIGINVMNGKDNYGVVKADERIDPDGPDGIFSTLPVLQMVAAMKEDGIPAAVSYTAGTYLCNYLAYAVRHYASQEGLQLKSGFVHVPFLTSQVLEKPSAVASMPLEMIVDGLRACIRAIIADQ